MRISTAEMFRNGINAIQQQHGTLAKTQQQLSTGKRMLAPSDDPAGAVQALNLRERIGAVDQYARTAEFASARLRHEESVLEQMGQSLQRVRELTVAAANASQTNESRAAIAREMRQINDALVAAANTRDANGEYLFAGFRSTSQPFVRDPQGQVQYLGDLGQRRVTLAPDRSLAIGDSGGVFMNVPRGNGVFVAAPAADNTGTGQVTVMEVIGAAGAGESYRIAFTSPAAYEVLDGDGAVVATGDYTAGAAIDVGGQRIVVVGAPAAGDYFDIEPAGSMSVFAMVEQLADRLAAPSAGAAERAQIDHAAAMGLRNLDQALGRILEVRTDVGARMNAVASQEQVNADFRLQLESVLSGVEDLDWAEAISRFQLQQVALQAAQQTYAQLGRLSLFDFIR